MEHDLGLEDSSTLQPTEAALAPLSQVAKARGIIQSVFAQSTL